LLFNAVKLTPVGGVIGIGIRCAKAWVKIDIADSGQGNRGGLSAVCVLRVQTASA